MSGLIGQNFGRYQILELLGEGGMATVYKAYDTRLEREVAIKVIRREAFPPDEMNTMLKRFEREAKSLGRLSHPNIVGVIDYGDFEGSPYLVMVYLSGGTLKDRLGQPMPWQEAVQLILPIAHALEYVHDHNIINRDVKPSNILMTEKGQPMLTDFGLVKLFEDKDKVKVKEAISLTSSGTGLGTPDYMAPEQWTGDPTAQSDLYSLGVVLYEMITGHRPYTADTPAGVLLKQATESLPLPKQYIPDLPQNVESVLLKVLARKPDDRYPNMRAFADELQNLLAGRDVAASTFKTKRLREQMTGKVERQPQIKQSQNNASLPTLPPARQKKAFPTLIAVFGALGVFALLVAFGAYWFISANLGMFVPATPTQQVLPSSTATNIPSTETAQPTGIPTETPLPTETPIALEITDNKNVPMRLVPAGEFSMGNDGGDAESRPASVVNLEAFYIDKYEVTNESYDACVYAVKCRRPQQTGSATRSTYYKNTVFANYPVIYVDWKMAKAYCEWRGARLPTEAEWEKAARGTDGRSYPWEGDKLDCSFANFSGCVGDTTPVDQHEKGQSVYGVYGMAGNVWEWTSTLFRQYPYNATDGREDPDASGKRMARGGSWHEFGGNSGNVRTDTRLKLEPGYYGAYVGFRCAVTK
ncbi:MAG: bifunctional serine/threonine-protein kinase/formylglycine-generating enzyme family protein [Anaerolineales bacterium]|nr:bifunctional serine/threonine-protein kinase/formylglycine-generating enzyme family protein [Anaerolineales bacterium]